MPFNPQATYIGDQLIGSGLANFGNNLGDALQRYHQEHQAQIAADQTAFNLTQTPGYDGKPILSKGAYERYMASSGAEHAAKLAGTLQALQVGRQALQQAIVPYTVGGQTYNIPPSQAAQLQTTQSQQVPTQVGGKTINLPPTSAASAELEKQRIEQEKQRIAKSGGLTPYQQFEMTQAQQKALDEKIKASPEFKFTQDYKLPPRQVLQPDVLNVAQPGKPSPQAYQLFAHVTTDLQGNPKVDPKTPAIPIQPEYDQYGVPRVPSYATSSDLNAQPYWAPTSSIFREKKIESNVGGVKQTNYYPDPSGEHVNIGGQRIPYSEVQGIKNRHDQLLGQAQAALKAGKDPQVLAQWWDRLGYDPRELLQ